MRLNVIEKLEYGKLATFIPNKRLPIYSWFYFKEGFARDLVFELVRMFDIKNGWILDPFCGSGTTLLACKELGINAIGYDVLPISVFVSRVKTRDYDIKKLKKIGKRLLKEKFEKMRMNIPKFVKKYFSPYILEDVIFFREKIERLNNPERDFFLLALMNSTIKCSYIFKDGGVLKVKRKPVPPLREMLRRTIKRMIKDLEELKTKPCEIVVEERDVRCIDLENCIDGIITSPPYLNKIEYTKVYEIEHILFFGKKDVSTLRSFIGSESKKEEDFSIIENFIDESMPIQAKRYLKDMYVVVENLYKACKPNAMVGMVVGNGCFPDCVVEVDVILSEMANEIGFEPKQIIVLNKRVCTTPSRRKIGIARESLLIWKMKK